MEAPVVRLSEVHAAYEGERIATLRGVTIQLARAERVAIIGPNGAGKTTLLEVINGLLPVTAGEVTVFGRSVRHDGHWVRARIAYMAQDQFFDPTTPFLVKDVVASAVYGRVGWLRWPSREDRDRIRSALSTVGIEGLARRPIGRLSGGQQRKALLARALAQHARVLLLDEPTANLDPDAKRDVARIVQDVEAQLDATALIVSHEGGLLLESADRLIRMEDGRITHNGPMSELRGQLRITEV